MSTVAVLAAGLTLVVAGLWWLLTERHSGEQRWPLVARRLLTESEQALYRRLRALYPEHIVLAQVALSQLLDVSPSAPNRQALRNHFSQLVADFVLCERDFRVLTVIELDDWSHRAPARQLADARKLKALESAGLRLVRIPEGALPWDEELRRVVNIGGMGTEGSSTAAGSVISRRVKSETAAVVRPILAAVTVGTILLLGWLIYSQVVVRAPMARAAPIPAVAAAGPRAVVIQATDAVRVVNATRSGAEPETKPDAAAAAKVKDRAFATYYATPASCEHPPTWADQVECGNRYMRARKEFDVQWAGNHTR